MSSLRPHPEPRPRPAVEHPDYRGCFNGTMPGFRRRSTVADYPVLAISAIDLVDGPAGRAGEGCLAHAPARAVKSGEGFLRRWILAHGTPLFPFPALARERRWR